MPSGSLFTRQICSFVPLRSGFPFLDWKSGLKVTCQVLARRCLRSRCAVAGLALAALSFVASAQVVPGNQLPEALRDLPSASGKCPAPAGRAGVGLEEDSVADMSCAISIHEGIKWLGDGVMVDVRIPTVGDVIPGALVLTPEALRSKPYWRDKAVLLVGGGKDQRELYVLCNELKRAGYRRIRVLRGGAPALALGTAAPESLTQATAQILRLSAAEFWREAQFQNNVILYVAERSSIRQEVPSALAVPALAPQAIRAAVTRSQSERKIKQVASVILVIGPSVPSAARAELFRALLPMPVLFVEAPDQELRQARADQALMWAARDRGPRALPCGL